VKVQSRSRGEKKKQYKSRGDKIRASVEPIHKFFVIANDNRFLHHFSGHSSIQPDNTHSQLSDRTKGKLYRRNNRNYGQNSTQKAQ
jgi:hypothetical protein